jgi:hypothetical protein
MIPPHPKRGPSYLGILDVNIIMSGFIVSGLGIGPLCKATRRVRGEHETRSQLVV